MSWHHLSWATWARGLPASRWPRPSWAGWRRSSYSIVFLRKYIYERAEYQSWGPIMGKGNSSNFKTDKDIWFQMPWTFKPGHLQAIKPLLFPNFCNLYTFILGAISYYPRGPIMGKGNSHNPKTEWDSGFSVLGTFVLDHLHHFKPISLWNFFNFFTFILGSQFLLPQRANNEI